MKDPLVQIADTALSLAQQVAGEHLECHRGCAICCFGPFPITELDAVRLRHGLRELSRDDPHRAEEIVDRARFASAELAMSVVDLDEEREFDLATQFSHLPCPVLDPQSGECSLYEHRPFACRTYGPPLLLDGEKQPHCPLCFKNASPAQIEAARVAVDTSEVTGYPHELQARTLIAWALASEVIVSKTYA